ncbi:hypothetical protein GQ54DRAFT_294882 [Martensiomyces pterosporus]|nr:hypothetical protein GQ54DRAFT_294882 [Martensiomyces pterosporus]
MSSALNFGDKIRSKEYSAKEVARTLRKRLEFPNPNVQILTLKLTDICVKNGGSLIQLEVSGREFVDATVALLSSKSGRDFELRELILKLIQDWAILFRGNDEMGYVNGVFERLKRTGYTFPTPDLASGAAMVDTASAPEWEDSALCQRCRTSFTFTNRKHHCRHCGKCFCQDCSSNNTPIPKFAIYDPVRVCHGCYLRLKKIVPDADNQEDTSSGQGSSPAWGGQASSAAAAKPLVAAASTPNIDDEDEDLKRAIELSLQESQNRPNYADYTLPKTTSAPAPAPAAPATTAYSPAVNYPAVNYPAVNYPAVPSEPHPLTSAAGNPVDEDEDDDPDLRAAIEASLRDMPDSAVPDYMANPDPEPAVYEGARELDFMPPVADEEKDDEDDPLTATERENVQLFESLLARIRDSGQDIRYDPQIQYLHESIDQLHPKITDAMDRVDQKHKEFIKLHDRIITAIKIYDQLLDKRLRSSTFITAEPSSPAVPSYLPAPQSIYPTLPAQQPVAAPQQPQQSQYPQAPPSGVYPNQMAYSLQPPQSMMAPQSPLHVPAAMSQQNQQHPTVTQTPLALQPTYVDNQQQQQQSGSYQQLPPTSTYLQHPTIPNAGIAISTGFSTSPSHQSPMPLAPVSGGMDPTQQQQQPVSQAQVAAAAAASPLNGALSHSPPTNPYYVPPPVVHAPNIPVLQPLPARTSSAPTHPAPAAPEVAASAPPPEEAPLIEF